MAPLGQRLGTALRPGDHELTDTGCRAARRCYSRTSWRRVCFRGRPCQTAVGTRSVRSMPSDCFVTWSARSLAAASYNFVAGIVTGIPVRLVLKSSRGSFRLPLRLDLRTRERIQNAPSIARCPRHVLLALGPRGVPTRRSSRLACPGLGRRSQRAPAGASLAWLARSIM
jgi:hypothetical protein